jgi:hypothetical protein
MLSDKITGEVRDQAHLWGGMASSSSFWPDHAMFCAQETYSTLRSSLARSDDLQHVQVN